MNERRITRGVTQRIHQKHVRRHSLILSWVFPLSISQSVSRCLFLGVLRHSQKVFHKEISEEFPEVFFVLFLGGLLINCFSFQSFKDCHFILHFIDIYFVLNSFSNFSRYYLLPANMTGILLTKIKYLRLQSWSK